jgi:hypothetical protein
VKIVDATPGRIVTQAELESLGLVALPEPAPAVIAPKSRRRTPHTKANALGRTMNAASRAPSREGDGPDRGMEDFFWCMMAAQRGRSIGETASKLLEVSAKAQERARLRDEGYALIIAQNAAAAAERGKQRGRG